MEIKHVIEHQRIIPMSRVHAFKFSDEMMRAYNLREGVDYTLVLVEETSGDVKNDG